MKLRFLTVLALALLMAFPAYALDLHEARNAGFIGETLGGYVAPLKETAEIKTLVRDINGKRAREYARISGENGQPVEIVGKLAAEQIIKRLEPGNYYQGPDGKWRTR